MRAFPLLLVLALLGLGACSSTGSLNYVRTVPVAPGPSASVSDVTATDMRDEKPNRLATVRGGYGNPAFVRDTATPVSQEVAGVFAAALQARGMLSPPGTAPYRVQLVLHKFYGNTYLDENAYINIDLIVVDRSGRAVYQDTVDDKRSHFALFAQNIDSLQNLVQALLSATADRMLDNPRLRAVLGGSVPVASLQPGTGPGHLAWAGPAVAGYPVQGVPTPNRQSPRSVRPG